MSIGQGVPGCDAIGESSGWNRRIGEDGEDEVTEWRRSSLCDYAQIKS